MLDGWRNSRPLVLEADDDGGLGLAALAHESIVEGHARGQGEGPSVFLHGLDRILGQVQENLFKAIGVGQNFGNRRIEDAFELNVLGEGFGFKEFDDLVEQAVEIHASPIEGFTPGEDHQFVDQARDSIDLTHDELCGLLALGVLDFSLQEFGCSADAPERVLHLVRDARRDLSVGDQAITLGCLVLKIGESGSVTKDHHGTRRVGSSADREWRDRDSNDPDRSKGSLQGDLVVDDGPPGLLYAGGQGRKGAIRPQ